MLLLLRLAWRDFTGSGLLWALSALAVALGVSTVVAADVVRGAMLRAMQGSADLVTMLGGLIDQLGSNLVVMGIAISLASGFVVFNAFGMSVARRRVRIAMLRTAGMTRRQVLVLTLIEALFAGGLGAGLGLLLGPLMGALAIAALKAATTEGTFLFEYGAPAPAALLLAAGLGMVVSVAAALLPALVATRVPPLAARRPQQASGLYRSSGRRVLAGPAGLIGILVYLRLLPPAAGLRPPWDGRVAVMLATIWLALVLALVPELAALAGRLLRRPLQALIGASGLLVADNLRRGRRRVWLTMASLAVSLALVMAVMGFTRFTAGSLMQPKLEQAAAMNAWSVASFNPLGGMAEYGHLRGLTLDPADVQALRAAVDGRAEVLEFGFVTVPELSYFGDSYFSFVMHPADARLGGDWLFSFNQGDWQRAVGWMESGCGALVMPTIAAQLDVTVGDPLELTGPAGPVTCTLAGVGAAFGAASIVGTPDRGQFGAERPFTLMVRPLPGIDRGGLDRDLLALAEARGIVVISMQAMTGIQLDLLDQVPKVLNGMAVLAVIAAALGVVNTVTIGVVERRRELGLYRAIGATRRQLFAVVVGEAGLIAALAGGLGVLGGAGVTIMIATVYGGASWGLPDLDHWAEGLRILQPAVKLGFVGWAVTPVIGALAGLLPARALLMRRGLLEELLAERH